MNSVDKKDYDVVFLGGLFPEEAVSDIIDKSIGLIDNAANNLQWKIVRGLDGNLSGHVKIINSMYIGSYPRKYRAPFIRTHNFQHALNCHDINVGFVNVSGIKHFSRYISLRPYLEKWAANESPQKKVVIAYALTSVFVELLNYVKTKYPHVYTVIVVPDLPQYMNTSNVSGFASKSLRDLSTYHVYKRLVNIDAFVLLTKHMADALHLKNKPYVVVEGISDCRSCVVEVDVSRSDLVNVVYTGTLNERYGAVDLVKAFMEIKDSNYRLILCGAGDSEILINDYARQDSRIIFKGQLPYKEIYKIQKQATVLVNPRQNNESFTKYSFPSKIMEYLCSGRPVIAYKLDGMPDDYDKYIFYVNGNNIESLSRKIMEVCGLPEEQLQKIGSKSKNWVEKHKNATVQAAKIINLIHDMHG